VGRVEGMRGGNWFSSSLAGSDGWTVRYERHMFILMIYNNS
jgi:hypothetical protein